MWLGARIGGVGARLRQLSSSDSIGWIALQRVLVGDVNKLLRGRTVLDRADFPVSGWKVFFRAPLLLLQAAISMSCTNLLDKA